MRVLEAIVWLGVITVLSVFVVAEGRRRQTLEREIALSPRDLYAKLARSSVRLQVVDARRDVVAEYEDAHIPGALPFPGCDASETPNAARSRILPSVPTIVVSSTGDRETFARCENAFGTARNLAGGMAAWSDAGYPEDSGEYVAPKPSMTGGCL